MAEDTEKTTREKVIEGLQAADAFTSNIARSSETIQNQNQVATQQAHAMVHSAVGNTMAGNIYNQVDNLSQAMGGSVQATNLGTNADAANMAASFVPGLGFAAKPLPNVKMTEQLQASSAYDSTKAKVAQAESNSGVKALFGQSQGKALANEAIAQQNKVTQIQNQAQNEALAAQNNIVDFATNNANKKKGVLGADVMKGEEGGTLQVDMDSWFDSQFDKFTATPHPGNNTQMFKQGGAVNVIPEGALHARLHHMENAEDLTRKGIPVIDIDGVQQAEIECNEIIFHLELTKQLEELKKQWEDSGHDSQYALEAGKLLTEEILHNTEDRTKLIRHTKI